MRNILFGLSIIICTTIFVFNKLMVEDNLLAHIPANQAADVYSFDIAGRNWLSLDGEVPIIPFVSAKTSYQEISKNLHKHFTHKCSSTKEFSIKQQVGDHVFQAYCISNIYTLSRLKRLNI